MASQLERYADAEEYINECLATGVNEAEELDVVAEKAKILSALHKYTELAAFLPAYIKKYADIPSLHALLGHAHWNLENDNAAAAAWNKAHSLDTHNALYASLKKQAQEKLRNKPAAKKTTEKPKAKRPEKGQPADPEKKARKKRPKDTGHENIP
jgi:tetratricopeptide (TPR) repeat protein